MTKRENKTKKRKNIKRKKNVRKWVFYLHEHMYNSLPDI